MNHTAVISTPLPVTDVMPLVIQNGQSEPLRLRPR